MGRASMPQDGPQRAVPAAGAPCDGHTLLRNSPRVLSLVPSLTVPAPPCTPLTQLTRPPLTPQDGLLLVFVCVLLWTFRMRAGNAYLVLGEAVGMETTTELGVLGAPPKRAGPSQPVGGGVYDTAFTLDEEEEEEERLASAPASGSAAHRPSLNSSAARKGVVVTDLPSTPH